MMDEIIYGSLRNNSSNNIINKDIDIKNTYYILTIVIFMVLALLVSNVEHNATKRRKRAIQLYRNYV